MEVIERVIEFGKWLCDDLEMLFRYEVSIRYLTYNLIIAIIFSQKRKLLFINSAQDVIVPNQGGFPSQCLFYSLAPQEIVQATAS